MTVFMNAMGVFARLWESMDKYKYVSVHECLWKFVRVYGCLWEPMGICEFLRVYRSLWGAMGVGSKHTHEVPRDTHKQP